MAQNQKGNAQTRQPMITTGKLFTEIGRENRRESEVHAEEQRQSQGRESQEERPACSVRPRVWMLCHGDAVLTVVWILNHVDTLTLWSLSPYACPCPYMHTLFTNSGS